MNNGRICSGHLLFDTALFDITAARRDIQCLAELGIGHVLQLGRAECPRAGRYDAGGRAISHCRGARNDDIAVRDLGKIRTGRQEDRSYRIKREQAKILWGYDISLVVQDIGDDRTMVDDILRDRIRRKRLFISRIRRTESSGQGYPGGIKNAVFTGRSRVIIAFGTTGDTEKTEHGRQYEEKFQIFHNF
jgi:hypothetical protein